VAMQNMIWALSSTKSTAAEDYEYDSDSYLIAVDNCSSRCITNEMTDFVSTPKKTSTFIKGIGGTVKSTYIGTARWSILDDTGQMHTWDIPNTYYNESPPYRLLSPQHWAQTYKDGMGPGQPPTTIRWNSTGKGARSAERFLWIHLPTSLYCDRLHHIMDSARFPRDISGSGSNRPT
jgi:hypothetical protein